MLIVFWRILSSSCLSDSPHVWYIIIMFRIACLVQRIEGWRPCPAPRFLKKWRVVMMGEGRDEGGSDGGTERIGETCLIHALLIHPTQKSFMISWTGVNNRKKRELGHERTPMNRSAELWYRLTRSLCFLPTRLLSLSLHSIIIGVFILRILPFLWIHRDLLWSSDHWIQGVEYASTQLVFLPSFRVLTWFPPLLPSFFRGWDLLTATFGSLRLFLVHSLLFWSFIWSHHVVKCTHICLLCSSQNVRGRVYMMHAQTSGTVFSCWCCPSSSLVLWIWFLYIFCKQMHSETVTTSPSPFFYHRVSWCILKSTRKGKSNETRNLNFQ